MDKSVPLEFFAKKFNIDKDYSNVYFFELDDNVFNFSQDGSNPNMAELNRLKFNNILLYFILMFIVELNGAQIAMMFYDKIANIYTFLKYGSKIFGNILIKKNINDNETVPITNYPVLCYLIFIISYFLIKYTLWYSPATKKSGVFNPVVQKEIINSIAELFNGLSIEAGRQQKDIVYDFTMTKLYTQLNSTFKNPSIIKILKQQHMKYSDTVPTEGQTVTDNTSELIKTYSIDNPIEIILPVQKIRSYKLSNGEAFYKLDDIMYQKANHSEPITNCPTGDYHDWNTIKGKTVCTKCNEILDDVEQKTDAEKDTDTDAYYFTLNMIANKRCLSGTMQRFVGKGDKFTCSICGHGMNEKYSKADWDNIGEKFN